MMIKRRAGSGWLFWCFLGLFVLPVTWSEKEREEAEAREKKVLEERLAEEAKVKALFSYSLRDIEDYIVTISCKNGSDSWSGSGFIAKMDGRVYLFTNQHVVLGADTITFKTVSGLRPAPVGVHVPKTGDIIRFLLKQEDGLELADKVLVKDPIAIFGNSLGGGVATALYGMVTVMDSELIEVSADAVSGNSGSPVLNLDKQVVGIVSHVRSYSRDETGSKSQRFCHRLLNREWGSIHWKSFNGKQAALYRKTEANVDELLTAAYRWYNTPVRTLDFENHSDMGIRRWFKDHNAMVNRMERMRDQKWMTQRELDSINKLIRTELMNSAEALGEICRQRARQVSLLASQKGLTGYLEAEYEMMSERLLEFDRSVTIYKQSLESFNYFYFE
jgi:hypothetical protein